jgi:rhodanese-related sulfurtransferase
MANKVTSKELQEGKEEYTILDVRETDELEEGKIDGAVNIPLGQLIRKARHGDIDDLKRKKIITYCNSGYRGNIAADELNKQGFDTVTIEGGYSAWKDYGIKRRIVIMSEVWKTGYQFKNFDLTMVLISC